jgi:hypothetical protein
MAILLVSVALVFDLVQLAVYGIALIPIFGWFLAPIMGIAITTFAMLLFGMWLTLVSREVTYFLQPRRMVRAGISALAEVFPLFSMLPILTISVAFTAHSMRKEDRAKQKASQEALAQAAAARREMLEMELYASNRNLPRVANDNRDSAEQMYQESLAA